MAVIELNGSRLPGRPFIFDRLRDGAIVVIRGMPEILALGATLRRISLELGADESELDKLLRTGSVQTVQTLSHFYTAFRQLRDTRYISSLFSEAVGQFGVPDPVLIDTGYCRMVVPDLEPVAKRMADAFGPGPFEYRGINETEPMLCGTTGGCPHRDIDTRHSHFQVNFWFPLHNIAKDNSLLLFPEVYRRDVMQYGPVAPPDNPNAWGFGRALQVPLRFGDTLVFHSQQLHASPFFSAGQSRFTVELRVAAGCIDDNSRTYRRLFWRAENFPGAQDFINRVFRNPAAALAAGYLRRHEAVLDNAQALTTEDIAHFNRLPSGEDMKLMMVRLLWHQNHDMDAIELVRKTVASTDSYFWALEAGRLAAERGVMDVARAAFERAEQLATGSLVALNRYTPDMPRPRTPWRPQLLPGEARKIAKVFRRRTYDRGACKPGAFDYEEYLRRSPRELLLALRTRQRRFVENLRRSFGSRRERRESEPRT